MILGLVLFWVGAVLFLNGLWLRGSVGDREIAVIDVFVGFLTLVVSLYLALGPAADASSIRAAALTLMFSFTYFWVAWNRWNGADGRGLGWFCLFVAITTVPVFLQTLSEGSTTWDIWLALNWLSWGALWFLFFLILARGYARLIPLTAVFCMAQGIYTGWLPGYLLLSGLMPGMPLPS